MSVTSETHQSAMGPYVAMAEVAFESNSVTAVFREGLLVNVWEQAGGLGGGGGNGEGGGGDGDGGGADGGGGDGEGGGGDGDGGNGKGDGGGKGGNAGGGIGMHVYASKEWWPAGQEVTTRLSLAVSGSACSSSTVK